MAVGMAMIELVGQIAHEEEENVPLFELLVESLSAADASAGDPIACRFRFEVRLAGILGFKPVFDQCVSCGKGVPDSKAEIRFELERGGPLCSKCRLRHGQTVTISGTSLHFLAGLNADGRGEGRRRKEPDVASRTEIDRLLESFLRKHVSGVRNSNSGRVFSRLLAES